jgi:protein phosphatase 2C family protein 2/3
MNVLTQIHRVLSCRLANNTMGDTLGKPVTDKHTTAFTTTHMAIAACGMQGWRKKMEDAHAIDFKVGKDPRAAFMAVFDGHNGSAAAKYCSLHLLDNLLAQASFQPAAGAARDVGAALTAAFLDTDRKLKATEHREEGGCTAVAVVALEGRLYCANVGDSRAVAYRRQNGALVATPMSVDHRPTLAAEADRVARAGGSIQHGRVGGLLALTRAMGDFEFKTKGEDDVITARPDITELPLSADVEFVVVACDGVWDVMTNEAVGKLVAEKLVETSGDVGFVCELLLDSCVADVPHGLGTDNMTCVIWRPKPSLFEVA